MIGVHTHDGERGIAHAHQTTSRRPLIAAIAITSLVFIIEVVGGLATGSLALLADAGHMLSDVMALSLSAGALWIAGRPHTSSRTYGFHRAEVLAALANAVALIVIVAIIGMQAIQRFSNPTAVEAGPMLAVATLGLGANIVAAAILFRGNGANLNQRGAFLHVVGDALGSIGAIAAGVVILATGWYLADPIVSLTIGLIILVSATRLLWDTLNVLLESSPPGIHTEQVRDALREVGGIEDIHDLHIWTVTSGFVALSAHARVTDGIPIAKVLHEATDMLQGRFGIRHATIQPETEPFHAALERKDMACCLDDYVEPPQEPGDSTQSGR